jgi:hypothetical protein
MMSRRKIRNEEGRENRFRLGGGTEVKINGEDGTERG